MEKPAMRSFASNSEESSVIAFLPDLFGTHGGVQLARARRLVMDIQCGYNGPVPISKRRKATSARKVEDIRLRVTKAEKAAFNKAAKSEGRGLSNWLRWHARKAAGMPNDA